MRKWYIIAPAALLALALAVLWLKSAERRHHGRYHYYTGPADPALPALLEAHGYAIRELEVAPDVKLRGIVRLPSSQSARFMLFFPGNAEQQLAATLPALESIRGGRDLGIAAFTYRGFDGSSGVPSVTAAEHDARSQLAYLRDQLHVTHERLVLAGYSMGSGIALRLAAELSRAQQPPAAVLLLSPFWTLELGPSSPMEFVLPSEFYRTEDSAPDVRAPLLVIAGADDQALASDAHARRLVKALPAGTEYWELPGRGHVDYLSDDALLARAGSFVLQK